MARRSAPSPVRSRSIRRRALALLAGATAAVGVAAVVPATAEAEAATHPAPFTNCPTDWTSPDGQPLASCLASVGMSGTFTLGATTVTLPPGTTLQGGLGVVDGNLSFVPATDGRTLTAPDVDVPGGVLGVAEVEHLLPGITDISAAVKLVGTPTFSLGSDIEIGLPIEVDLKNDLLGPTCAIGSAADPIVLHLTTGTTTPPAGTAPITGSLGDITSPQLGSASVIEFQDQTLVDNSFAVPGAHGCGPLDLLDGAVDGKSALPSPAGKNLASLTNSSYLVSVDDVDKVSGYQPGA